MIGAPVRFVGDGGTIPELHAALERFTADDLNEDENFATFVAVFDGPLGLPEEQFETELWGRLPTLHRRS